MLFSLKSAILITTSQHSFTKLLASYPNFDSVKTIPISAQYTHAQSCMWSCVLTFPPMSSGSHITSYDLSTIQSHSHQTMLHVSFSPHSCFSSSNFLEDENDSEKGGHCPVNNWPTKPYHDITATSAQVKNNLHASL